MKMILEVTDAKSGTYGETEKRWARLQGRDQRGRRAGAAIFGPAAKALVDEISRLVPEGEEIGNRRLLVDLAGEWRDDGALTRGGKPVTQGDGSAVMRRTFFATEFKVLTGPTLELARLKRESDRRMEAAERMRAAGDTLGAYRVLAEFVSMACGRPFTIEPDAHEGDDEEFGAGSAPPEVAAAEDEVNGEAPAAPAIATSEVPAEQAGPDVPAADQVVASEAVAAPVAEAESAEAVEVDVVEAAPAETVADAAPAPTAETVAEAAPTAVPLDPEEAAAATYAAADRVSEAGEAVLREADAASPRDLLDDGPAPVAAAPARFGMRRPAGLSQARPAPTPLAAQPRERQAAPAQRAPDRAAAEEPAPPPPRPRGLRPLGRSFGR